MRVLFDGFWWLGGPPSGRLVLQHLVRAWHDAFEDDVIILAVPTSDIDEVRKSAPVDTKVVGLRFRPHAVAAALEMPVVAHRYGANLSITQNFTPLWGHSAVFLHDVLFQTNPEWFTLTERLYFSPMTLLARRADAVFTSSSTEAARIARCNPSLQAPVAVGLAVSSALLEASSSRPSGVNENLPFVLSVGRLNVRKNLSMTIMAAQRSKSVSPELPLLVVGESQGKMDRQSPEIQAAVQDGTVQFLGYVSDPELKWLYEHARLFLFLSLDEGFGLPPLEARRFGTPVLVSDIPVFHETLANDATYANPADRDQVARAIDLALHDGPQSGLVEEDNHMGAYSWDASVRRMRETVTSGRTE